MVLASFVVRVLDSWRLFPKFCGRFGVSGCVVIVNVEMERLWRELVFFPFIAFLVFIFNSSPLDADGHVCGYF
jgi:hypothetical protein